ncbi:MAG: histone deacetylase family protein, partial [Chloroflexi bacterium]|nr:histone deacetylase family protein [Chloroflexota bacterium]
MPVAMLFRPELREYDFGPGHPFRGDRFDTITGFLKEKLPPEGRYEVLAAPPATEEDLRLICDEDYIDFTRRYFEAAHQGLNDNGQFSRYHSPDNHPAGRPGKVETAARYIVGQARLAADLVLSGRQTKAISLGGGLHHAKRRYGEGFCLYNDVAFAGTYLLEKLGLKRLLILDTDAHAGNGTREYFYAEPRVLFID